VRPRHINFLTNAAVSASGIFIPLYASQLGSTAAQIGFIVAAFNGFSLFSSFLFGRAADVRGIRRILRAGLLLSGTVSLTQPLAFDPWSLAASRALLGFCVGMYPAALLAYAKTADRLMGKFSSWGSLGWAFGNALAGVTAATFPGAYWQVFALSSGAWFLAFFLTTGAPEEAPRGMRVPFFPKAVLRRNVPVYAMMLIRHTGANMVWAIFPLYLRSGLGLDDLHIGIIYALNPFVQFAVMREIDRYRSSALVLAGLAGSTWTFFLFTLAWDFWSMLSIQVLLGFSWATLYVGALKFITEKNPETATAGGWFNSVTSLSSILGPIFGGILASRSYLLPMYTASLLSAVAFAVYVYEVRFTRPAAVPG